MRKALTAALAALLLAPSLQAQDIKKIGVKPYGFVRNYLNIDSRRTYTVLGGEYNMMPYDRAWNADSSADLNAVARMQLQALSSRVGLDITGPTLLGMESSGRIEGDFGGFGATNSVLRLRLAYLKLSSEREGRRSELVVGQDWHPLSGDIMPDVLGMAAGAPFRPHSRTPQLRGTTYWGAWGLTAALLSQLQFMNNGPASATSAASTASLSYAYEAMWPEAFVGVQFRKDGYYVQVGLDAQLLRPRTHAQGPSGAVTAVDERVGSLTPTLYGQYVGDKWSVKMRAMLAQNTTHMNQLVGYAVTGVRSDGSWEYAPMRAAIGYVNVAYGKKCRVNLFGGYMKNLGCADALHDFGLGDYRIYMKGGDDFTNLGGIWRVAPSVSYNVKAFNIGLEYEVTGAVYGDVDSHGAVAQNGWSRGVVNHRVCTMVKYNF